MYVYKGLWSLRAEIMIIFEVTTDIHTTPNSTYRLGSSGRMGRVKNMLDKISTFSQHVSLLHLIKNVSRFDEVF